MNDTDYRIDRIDEETLSTLGQYTFPQILSRQAERLGSEKIAIREKAYGIWQTYNWREYLRYTKCVALGLISLGLKRGENVGLILDNHPEWLFSELGAQSLGAVTVPLFTSAVAKEQALGLKRFHAAYVFAQDQAVRAARSDSPCLILCEFASAHQLGRQHFDRGRSHVRR